MSKAKLHIGIKNVTAEAGDGVCELHFLSRIENREYFDWDSFDIKEESLVSSVVTQLNAVKPKKVLCLIDSWGGDADAGAGVYNVLKNYPAKVEVDIVNKAASAATAIACSGSKIKMPKTGMYIIHQAQSAAAGTAKDLREAADVADMYTRQYCEIYAMSNRKGKTADEIMALIADGDYWMTGEEAEQMGFVDECYNNESVTVTACIEEAKAIYGANIPKRFIEMSAAPAAEKTLYQQILTEMKSFKEMVTAALTGKKVTAKVGDNMEADITTAISPILADLAAEMEGAVTAEIATVTDKVTADVTAKLTAEYGATVTAQAQTITELKESITAITADLTKLAGKQSPAAGVSANADGDKPKLTGKFAGE